MFRTTLLTVSTNNSKVRDDYQSPDGDGETLKESEAFREDRINMNQDKARSSHSAQSDLLLLRSRMIYE
jgi:hypothetical protein